MRCRTRSACTKKTTASSGSTTSSATGCSRCGARGASSSVFFATVGNYDYGFYWYLYQDGTVQLETKLTGIIQTTAVMPGETYRWGGMVDDNLGGPTHQHFFNARLHMDIDGGGNTVSEHEFVPRPWGRDNPHGNVFDTTSRDAGACERDAARIANGETGRFWKISNPSSVTNAVGGSPAYKLIVNRAR